MGGGPELRWGQVLGLVWSLQLLPPLEILKPPGELWRMFRDALVEMVF